MGRHWYEREGKYLAKKNTFFDFCDAAEHLIAKGFTTTPQVPAWYLLGTCLVPAYLHTLAFQIGILNCNYGYYYFFLLKCHRLHLPNPRIPAKLP
eukprot:990422-Rhodomonas_salina.1